MDRRRAIDEWTSTVARIVGLVGLVAFAVEWMATGRIQPILVSAAGTLYGLGKAGEALAGLRRGPPPPVPVPDSTVGHPSTTTTSPPHGGSDR